MSKLKKINNCIKYVVLILSVVSVFIFSYLFIRIKHYDEIFKSDYTISFNIEEISCQAPPSLSKKIDSLEINPIKELSSEDIYRKMDQRNRNLKESKSKGKFTERDMMNVDMYIRKSNENYCVGVLENIMGYYIVFNIVFLIFVYSVLKKLNKKLAFFREDFFFFIKKFLQSTMIIIGTFTLATGFLQTSIYYNRVKIAIGLEVFECVAAIWLSLYDIIKKVKWDCLNVSFKKKNSEN